MMHIKKQKYTALIYTIRHVLFLLLLLSCYRDPFDIDTSQFGTSVVIEGVITDQEGPQTVRISRTVKITDSDEFPRVSGAAVSISENSSRPVPLQEITAGIYQTYDLTGVPGQNYTLTVRIKEETYTASCVMPQPMTLNEMEFEHIHEGTDLYEISCSFKDRPDNADFCLFNVYYNRHLIDYYLYKDDMTNGQEVVLDNFDIFYGPNDQAIVEILTLDKTIYDFFYTLDVIVNNEYDEVATTLIPMTTLNPTTNLDNGALGYFSAHAIRRYEKTVE
jgi:hypothetical protein